MFALLLLLTPAPAPVVPAQQIGASAPGKAASIVRMPLMDRALSSQKHVQSVRATRILFGPGERSGAHVHPVPTMGVVLQGRITLAVQGQPVRELQTGDAFFEPADALILDFANASATEPASFVAFYLMGPNDEKVIR